MLKMRKLTTRDMFTVVDMLKKLAEGGFGESELSNLIVSELKKKSEKAGETDERAIIKIGILVLTKLYESLKPDLINWFASLIGKTIDEYMDSDPNTTLEIIDQLIDGGEETKNFFTSAFALFKKISALKNPIVKR